jgi:hypothetical protein
MVVVHVQYRRSFGTIVQERLHGQRRIVQITITTAVVHGCMMSGGTTQRERIFVATLHQLRSRQCNVGGRTNRLPAAGDEWRRSIKGVTTELADDRFRLSVTHVLANKGIGPGITALLSGRNPLAPHVFQELDVVRCMDRHYLFVAEFFWLDELAESLFANRRSDIVRPGGTFCAGSPCITSRIQ